MISEFIYSHNREKQLLHVHNAVK